MERQTAQKLDGDQDNDGGRDTLLTKAFIILQWYIGDMPRQAEDV